MTLPAGIIEIGDLIEAGAIVAVQDGNHGEKHPKASDYVDDGISFIMANDLNKGSLSVEGTSKIPESLAEKLRIGFSVSGDVLLTHKGTIGNTAIVPEIAPYVMLTPQVTYYRVNPEILNNYYLLYCFRENNFQKVMSSLAQQSTRPYIGITAQRKLKIFYRGIDAQTKIVEKIKVYDDLVENNLRRIKLLEETARLLFKEWFVLLRFPGHEHCEVINGLPNGWTEKALSEVVDVNARSLSKGYQGQIEYIDISCVSTNSIDSTTWYDFEDAPGRARRVLQHGDIIWSCVRPNRRSHALIWEPHERLIASTGFAVISARTLPFLYLYHVLTTNNYVGYLTNNAGGAAYPAVTASVFENSRIVVPDTRLSEQFSEYALPIYEQINKLRQANMRLSEARDLLLPRLMNGDITV